VGELFISAGNEQALVPAQVFGEYRNGQY
jgi:hypothetical protein